MKEQLLLFADDIKNNLRSFVMNTIQLVIGLLLLCYIFQVVLDFQMVKQTIHMVMNHTEIYMLRDTTSEKKFDKIINGQKNLSKLAELYHEVERKRQTDSANLNLYLADSSMRFRFSEDIDISEELAGESPHSSGKRALQLLVTDNFFSVYHLRGTFSGKNIENIFCIKEGKPVPLILGADFRSVFQLHDTIKDIHDKTYEVVGFLDEHSYYVAPDKTRDLIDLGNYVIRPYSVDLQDSVSIWSYFNGLYLMTDDGRVINDIAACSKKLGLFDFIPINFSYQLEAIVEDTLDEIFVNSTFLIIILIFSFVGMIGSLLQFIADFKREFAVHMLCGAAVGQIILRILMQAAVMFGIALAAVLVLLGLSKAYLLTLLCSVIFMIIVLISPIRNITKLTIQNMLKRSYE